MNVINEIASKSTIKRNIGGKAQALEAPVKTLFLAKEGFSFADKAAFKTESAWDTGIAAKNIIPLTDVEGIELANQDANIKEGRFRNYTLKEGVEGINYRLDVSIYSYDALKTYENSDYTRVFEVTTEGEVTCDVQSDGTIKGRKLKSLIVPLRNRATDEDTAFVNLNMKFNKDTYSIITPSFEVDTKEGIYDVYFEQVSASGTEIKVKAFAHFSSNAVTSFTDGDVIVKDAAGASQSVTFAAADANGVYTLTGTGFANGFTVGLNGVVTQTGINYEAPAELTITI